MSEPEIARRCPKCGASIRVAAFFCPQCGAEFKRQESEVSQPSTTPIISQANESSSEPAATVNDSKAELGSETLIETRDEMKKESRPPSELGSDTLIERPDKSKKESRPTSELDSDTLMEKRDKSKKESRPNSEPKTRTSELKTEKKAAAKAAAPEGARSRGQAARGAVGAQIQRATTMARDVEGDVIYRARKMREMSNVVWDEAGDDPNLRFVLVAAVLFLMFLVIVVLNRVIS